MPLLLQICFLFCFNTNYFMLSLSENNQAGAIELQLNKANSFDTEAPFLN